MESYYNIILAGEAPKAGSDTNDRDEWIDDGRRLSGCCAVITCIAVLRARVCVCVRVKTTCKRRTG